MNDITVTVIGNVVGEVQSRTTSAGVTVTSFRLAHNARYYNKSDSTWTDGPSTFVTVSCWRALGVNVAQSISKGMPVVVTGRLRQREYERTREDGSIVRTIYPDIEASAVGPDLSRGVATFRRTKAQAVLEQEGRVVADTLGAAALEGEVVPSQDEAGDVAA